MTLLVDRNVRVPMPDGVALEADVFRPGRAGRHPVVLLRTPYDRGNAPSFGTQLNALRLAEAGYVVVTQDVRGRGGSGGVFEPFANEAADGVATIEWVAGQRWSNGVVAMAGTSYCGYAQVLAARERPEALRAIIPCFAPLDARHHWVYEGDAFNLAFNLAWMLGFVVPSDRRTTDPAASLTALDDWQATTRQPVGAQPALTAAPAGAAYGDWLERGGEDGWWRQRSGRGAGRHDAAALVVGGWYDLFSPGTAALHAELAAGRAGPLQLLIGPWDHSPLPLRTTAGEVEFGSAAGIDLPLLEQRWLDHVLRDGEPPLPRAARAFVTGWNRWLDWDAWPPPGRELALYTTRAGGLAPDRPAAAVDRFAHSASDPAPTVGGRLFPRPGQMRSGPLDQALRAARPDVVGYRTSPVEADLLVAGSVRAEVWSGWSAGGGADLVATLVDEAPDGTALNVAEGVRRLAGDGAEPARFAIDLGPVAHAFRQGHRLRLDLAGASFPRIDRFPVAGSAERTIAHGGPQATRLILPVPA